MEILGIGAPELIFIIIIALIILGPKDMQKAGQTLGRWLNAIVKSDSWKAFQQTSREIRNLPTKLMREANLDETQKEIRNAMNPQIKPPASLPNRSLPPPNKPETKDRQDSVEAPEPESNVQQHE